jgi:hypothetical protein
LNKITPLEEKRVLTLAKRFPQLRCRRIAYELERKGLVFIGKTRVAEILKAHGLNHEFVRGAKRQVPEPMDMLSHEPWRKNLLWGMDWTYLMICGRFWYWGDLDAQGFEILDRLRREAPAVRSLGMDGGILDRFRNLACDGTAASSRELETLDASEWAAYRCVVVGNLRLEQEKVPMVFVKELLRTVFVGEMR